MKIDMMDVKRQYEAGGNIMDFLKTKESITINSAENIMVSYDLYGCDPTPLNPSGIMIIGKNLDVANLPQLSKEEIFACPVAKKPMKSYGDSFFCEESLLAYPIIQGIPCLTASNAVLASKYLSPLD